MLEVAVYENAGWGRVTDFSEILTNILYPRDGKPSDGTVLTRAGGLRSRLRRSIQTDRRFQRVNIGDLQFLVM